MGPDQLCAYMIHDNALAVSLLYCTLVVPREILALPKGHQILRDFDKENVVAAFEIVAPTQPTSRQLLLFSETQSPTPVSPSGKTTGQRSTSSGPKRSRPSARASGTTRCCGS